MAKYNHKHIEKGLYQFWLDHKLFSSGDQTKKPFVTVIPPPNVTGKLHLGHAMDNTLQDIIIRRKRMQGYDALYLPGMDHAGIATQAKVDELLKSRGISRYSLGREAYLEEAWKWKNEYAGHIRTQWESLGISVDYQHEAFTLDKNLNDAVNKVFIDLYNKGLIYRGNRIINWDVEANTALSNIEVEYIEEQGHLYYIRYPLVDSKDYMIVATTRPETMFGDQALMVHPDDERYLKYIGKEVYIPTTHVKIPVISDDYVDKDFGTGVVKVTPAHDPNDFEVGLRHNLEMPLCMTERGIMNALAYDYEGMERFECREQLLKDLDNLELLEKIEPHIHNVGHSERTGVVVEPRLSLQWFVDMKPLANQAILKSSANFYPSRFEKVFKSWMENIEDWCISRQLWWGHRIPVWYKDDQMKVQLNSPGEGWVQDEDVLDTWFSSALWPFSTLGWLDDKETFNRYYPTDVLVTGYDIIFFWVARMIFQGLEFTGKTPFKDVLIHGLIRDEKGRKMSKSLDNGIDPMDIIEKYGVDALRYFLSTNSTPGADMRFEMEKVESSWNFINKLWHMTRFVKLNLKDPLPINEVTLNDYDKDILSKLDNVIIEADKHFERYDFGEASRYIYNFTWDEFANHYIEYAKLNIKTHQESTNSTLYYVLTNILKLLHPFMPFVTERLYQDLTNELSIMVSSWPTPTNIHDETASQTLMIINDLIRQTRNFKQERNITKNLTMFINSTVDLTNHQSLLKHFLKTDNLHFKKPTNTSDYFLLTGANYEFYILKTDVLSIEEEIKEIKDKLSILEKELKRSHNLLSNENFINKASPSKVEEEREKQKHYQNQYNLLKEALDNIC
ncbi:MAG: valine--tRNA ligase [Acholeplasmataceae bacterium]